MAITGSENIKCSLSVINMFGIIAKRKVKKTIKALSSSNKSVPFLSFRLRNPKYSNVKKPKIKKK